MFLQSNQLGKSMEKLMNAHSVTRLIRYLLLVFMLAGGGIRCSMRCGG